MERITVYVSIGNSDDKLTQLEWHHFHEDVDELAAFAAAKVHGRWLSPAADPWQNACWCLELDADDADNLRRDLAVVADRWKQESIAWAEAQTTFIGPTT